MRQMFPKQCRWLIDPVSAASQRRLGNLCGKI
uniref:Uncharacterized protein n=1 Tax=Arundo donax TaxID=35708 RepID=A0A0A8YRI2_ARUDO